MTRPKFKVLGIARKHCRADVDVGAIARWLRDLAEACRVIGEWRMPQ